MALSRKDQELKDQVAAAASRLRSIDEPALASTVDFVLTPAGLAWLRRVREDAGAGERTHLIIAMPRTEKEHLRTVAKASGKNLSLMAEDGLLQFISGHYRPAPLPASTWGSTNVTSASLNLTVDSLAIEQAAEAAKRSGVAEDLGWKPSRLRPSNIARAYLLEQLPLFQGWPVKEMTAHYRACESAAEVAERFGYPQDQVLLMLERQGLRVYELEFVEDRRGLSAEEREEIVRRRADGETAQALAAEYGVAINVILKLAKMPRAQATLPVGAREEIARRRAAGESAQALAQEYGVSINTVYRYAKAGRGKTGS